VEELKERIANWQAYDDRGEAILRFKAEQQIPELIRQRDLATSPALSAAHNEITALKARLRMADERGDRWSILAKKQDEELAQLRARLEEVGRDGERYRWLRLAGVDPVISERFVNICESEPETPELFDAAIDSALAAQVGGRG